MTLDQIIDLADAVYPDGYIRMYHDDPDRSHGDTLAQFIAIELKETYDKNATDEEQLAEAGKVMRTAANELAAVAAAFGVTPMDEESIQIADGLSISRHVPKAVDEGLTRFVVHSYDDDQQQSFSDFIIAKNETEAIIKIGDLRPYAIPSEAVSAGDLRELLKSLESATPEQITADLAKLAEDA